jgi:hypothetical protein
VSSLALVFVLVQVRHAGEEMRRLEASPVPRETEVDHKIRNAEIESTYEPYSVRLEALQDHRSEPIGSGYASLTNLEWSTHQTWVPTFVGLQFPLFF